MPASCRLTICKSYSIMPFIRHTPESLLPRSDSKNPTTTCKGITSNGRPCRRALAFSPRTSPVSSPSYGRGVLAVLKDESDDGNSAAAFFCWQHKDQAEQLAAGNDNTTKVLPLKERTSIDTLVDRLGVLELDEEPGPDKKKKRRKRKDGEHAIRRKTLPAKWQGMEGPLISVPEELVGMEPSSRPKPRPCPQSRTCRRKSNGTASVFCCVRAVDDEDFPAARRREHRPPDMAQGPRHGNAFVRPTATVPQGASSIHRKPVVTTSTGQRLSSSSQKTSPTPNTPNHIPIRPYLASPGAPTSHTQSLLSLIPSSLSPQSTSLLLTELSRPISSADEEGYIYMFWLTPETASTPPTDVASSLLAPPSSSTSHDRRGSDVLRSYGTVSGAGSLCPNSKAGKTIVLKIGRAANVHRRLTQWSRQCGHDLTLIRFYPYTSSIIASTSPAGSPGAPPPRKVPHVHRVERLIHIELAERRAKDQGKCESCGKEHREWFEVDATREGVKVVDEVIRRWVGWAEGAT